jgi:hypothetical protein
MTYFRARHAKGDRLRSASFDWNGQGNFEFKLRRSVTDFRRGVWFGLVWKGAALCDGRNITFVVLSLGGSDSDRH